MQLPRIHQMCPDSLLYDRVGAIFIKSCLSHIFTYIVDVYFYITSSYSPLKYFFFTFLCYCGWNAYVVVIFHSSALIM